MTLARRHLTVTAAGSAAPIEWSASQPWPAPPLCMLVDFAAAGSSDVMTHIVAEHLGHGLGRSITVPAPAASSPPMRLRSRPLTAKPCLLAFGANGDLSDAGHAPALRSIPQLRSCGRTWEPAAGSRRTGRPPCQETDAVADLGQVAARLAELRPRGDGIHEPCAQGDPDDGRGVDILGCSVQGTSSRHPMCEGRSQSWHQSRLNKEVSCIS